MGAISNFLDFFGYVKKSEGYQAEHAIHELNKEIRKLKRNLDGVEKKINPFEVRTGQTTFHVRSYGAYTESQTRVVPTKDIIQALLDHCKLELIYEAASEEVVGVTKKVPPRRKRD